MDDGQGSEEGFGGEGLCYCMECGAFSPLFWSAALCRRFAFGFPKKEKQNAAAKRRTPKKKAPHSKKAIPSRFLAPRLRLSRITTLTSSPAQVIILTILPRDAPWVLGPVSASRPTPAERILSGSDGFFCPGMGFPSPARIPMLIERHGDAVVVWAPAKVNLFLEVLAKRPDSYHEIATLMAAVSLYDTLEIKEDASAAIRLQCNHAGLSVGADNLVNRAGALLRRRTATARGASLRLVKRIPLAAGLGGRAADPRGGPPGVARAWAPRPPRAGLRAPAA